MRHLLCLIAFVGLPVLAQSDADLVSARSAELRHAIANEHPRLQLRPTDLPALRAFWNALPTEPDGNALAQLAVPALDNKPLIAEPRPVKNGTADGNKLWQAGYKAAYETAAWGQRYALAWLLTQDPAYGREAARWLMHLASWHITADTYRTNDELFIQSLRPMLFAYDWAYDALTPDERQTITRALNTRMDILASQIQPKFSLTRPTSPDNSLSHPMRFISTLGQGGLVLLHENKAAAQWLAWSYEYYLRQFPVWGGPAGGWAEGMNYWSTGITQHQRFLEGMALQGFDAPLQRPFWRNTAYFGVYNQMPYGGSFFGDLNNIANPSGSIALILEKAAILNQDPYPLAYAKRLGQKPPTAFSYYTYDGIDAFLQRFRTVQAKLPEVALSDLPQSRYFDDIGVVSMHSALGDSANDIMLGFRSSPQGSASHGFADQNSFVLNAYGQPLAINSGYREFYDSPHHIGWSRQTKSKNAVLFGNQGQRIKDAAATGAITRFATGNTFSFASGDATAAYAPHATRALRHVFFVNRRYFLMLDEAAAPRAVPFQWQLHARSSMALAPEQGEITQQQKDARLTVRFISPAANTLTMRQTDAFDPPVNSGYQAKMPNEWHTTIETTTPAKQQDFLTLLYPWRANGAGAPPSQNLQATQGFATSVGSDTILIAREAEKQVDAAGWQLQGMAASFSPQGDALRFALVQVRSLQGALSLSASAPINAEGTRSANSLQLSSTQHEPVTLRIRPGFAVRQVSGASPWQQEADGTVQLQLPSGSAQIVLQR
ncbi:DUF4962 domain-containing protein [Curvibacter sp. CHRR-16]|uniref:DUF4962 domain-containing protein n=1 Tax=Curvibacter sp. CHRR-16 TaxID=2835872 RepID=UPI001BD99C7F|nr:heparinase II/III family protein [Curvibacter sp. CHRR-16]MBT0571081.1 DUF4962 domain-containing protein [Curvibacter sp. CHRR-16]